ncbi:MAG: hypothetical protein LQ342_007788 [Letrouitia transgressa]|nr:MAG: hypothetical protein LQ342_007788 [Letrouitia transgressa]
MILDIRRLAYLISTLSSIASTSPLPATGSNDLGTLKSSNSTSDLSRSQLANCQIQDSSDSGLCSSLQNQSIAAPAFLWRVPGTNTILGVTPRNRPLPPSDARTTINGARRRVETILRLQGDAPLPRGTFTYPDELSEVTVSFVTYDNRLKWSDVRYALLGLVTVMFERHLYREISFLIYDESHGIRLQEDGSGSIYSMHHDNVASVSL